MEKDALKNKACIVRQKVIRYDLVTAKRDTCPVMKVSSLKTEQMIVDKQ
jgi:hypothetical protein